MGRWLTTIKLSAEGLGVFAAGTWLVDHFLFDWLVRYLDGYGIHEADLIATVSSYVLPALISIAIVLFTYQLVKRGNGEDLMETRNDIKSPNAGRETLVVGAIPARLQTEDFSKVHARIRVLVSEGNELIRSYTKFSQRPRLCGQVRRMAHRSGSNQQADIYGSIQRLSDRDRSRYWQEPKRGRRL